MESEQLTASEKRKLMAVLRELDRGAPHDNRHENRRKVCVELQLRPLRPSRHACQAARLANISSRGLGLLVRTPMETATRFVTTLRFDDGGGWLVLCEVRNCRPEKTGFRIGARLLDRVDDPKGLSKPPMDWLL